MIDSPHKDYSLAPRASGVGSWLETVSLTALAIGLGLWLTPNDPLQTGGFPWALLAPLLVGVRYGFVKALASAAILVATLLVLRNGGLPAYEVMPAKYIIGTLVSSMLVGEFRDLWERRLQRLQMANEYRQYRLDEFTRAHQILRISHDRLEQRVAGSDQSLRSSLLILRERMRELEEHKEALTSLAEPILALLGQYGSLRVAALYLVENRERLAPMPLAAMGEMAELDSNDPLVRLCIEKGDLVSVREEFIERGEHRSFSSLQACVPLIDTEDNLLAILAIRKMPFFVFNDRTLSLLALLAGHVADLLQSDAKALKLDDADSQSFSQQLRRALIDVEQHNLSGSLIVLELNEPNEQLMRVFADSQRGLDLQLRVRNGRGRDCVLILMPLTSAEGARGYIKRLEQLLAERFGQNRGFTELGLHLMHYELEPSGNRAGLLHFLFTECALNDRQVAI
ncbi:MAG TPA: sugar transporter [Pseudomonas xinjiangensis]|uniref:Sugar transporter n=2 Tax=root TaxID=1 RepID=A0A7V1BQA0_9GAMM|nr:sugar transporter [Halopseudomonas xinjiangensis]HEC48802.1 sugar transporter [Halopseudomonas xinjiangensis]